MRRYFLVLRSRWLFGPMINFIAILFAVSLVVAIPHLFGAIAPPDNFLLLQQTFDQEQVEISDGAQSGDRFGATQAPGDFNGDLLDKLAVNVPF